MLFLYCWQDISIKFRCNLRLCTDQQLINLIVGCLMIIIVQKFHDDIKKTLQNLLIAINSFLPEIIDLWTIRID
jgi:hypothetical protein